MAKGKRNQRKINHSKIENIPEENNSIFKTIIVILVVLCFLGLFYLLAIHITNKNSDSSDSSSESSDTSSTSDYSSILLGSSFNKGDGEYIVVYYDGSNDDISDSIDSAISTYESSDDHLTVYTVDMSSAMNTSHATTNETNKNPSSVSELYINGPTLIKFSNHTVADYIEGLDSVVSYLG